MESSDFNDMNNTTEFDHCWDFFNNYEPPVVEQVVDEDEFCVHRMFLSSPKESPEHVSSFEMSFGAEDKMFNDWALEFPEMLTPNTSLCIDSTEPIFNNAEVDFELLEAEPISANKHLDFMEVTLQKLTRDPYSTTSVGNTDSKECQLNVHGCPESQRKSDSFILDDLILDSRESADGKCFFDCMINTPEGFVIHDSSMEVASHAESTPAKENCSTVSDNPVIKVEGSNNKTLVHAVASSVSDMSLLVYSDSEKLAAVKNLSCDFLDDNYPGMATPVLNVEELDLLMAQCKPDEIEQTLENPEIMLASFEDRSQTDSSSSNGDMHHVVTSRSDVSAKTVSDSIIAKMKSSTQRKGTLMLDNIPTSNSKKLKGSRIVDIGYACNRSRLGNIDLEERKMVKSVYDAASATLTDHTYYCSQNSVLMSCATSGSVINKIPDYCMDVSTYRKSDGEDGAKKDSGVESGNSSDVDNVKKDVPADEIFSKLPDYVTDISNFVKKEAASEEEKVDDCETRLEIKKKKRLKLSEYLQRMQSRIKESKKKSGHDHGEDTGGLPSLEHSEVPNPDNEVEIISVTFATEKYKRMQDSYSDVMAVNRKDPPNIFTHRPSPGRCSPSYTPEKPRRNSRQFQGSSRSSTFSRSNSPEYRSSRRWRESSKERYRSRGRVNSSYKSSEGSSHRKRRFSRRHSSRSSSRSSSTSCYSSSSYTSYSDSDSSSGKERRSRHRKRSPSYSDYHDYRSRSRSRSNFSSYYQRDFHSCVPPWQRQMPNYMFRKNMQQHQQEVEERRVVYVGCISEGTTKADLRKRFEKFGTILDLSLHFRDRGDNYGFVTFMTREQAYRAIECGNDGSVQPKYDLCFGGRRSFCKVQYSDLDAQNDPNYYRPCNNSQRELDFDSLLRAEINRHR